MQELIGGQWGEMSVMVNYLFQGWNCRGPAKYRDMLLDTATEEIGHVEMLATMVARLLETSPWRPRRLPKTAATAGLWGPSSSGAIRKRPSSTRR
jgi:Mn-containing catalase